MAESIAEVCTQTQPTIGGLELLKNFSFISPSNKKQINRKRRNVQAVVFKYKFNLSDSDIDKIRHLLTLERLEHENEKEFEFYLPDYERLMHDDWLVTRFLLRAIKASEKVAEVLEDKDDLFYNKDDKFHLVKRKESIIYEKTMELIQNCAKFRYQYQINGATQEKEFPLEWTNVNGLFCFKEDLVGNPAVYLRVALHRPKLIEKDELRYQFKRYMLYTLEKSDQELNSKPGKAICCVFDMTDVAFDNIDLELTTWMIKSFKSCGPKLLCYVLVYNPPWFFTATFKLICNTLLSNSKRQSIKFAYGGEILDYIDYDNLPLYIKSSLC